VPAGVGGGTPVPVKLTVWRLPPALSAMKSAALRAPAPVGLNITLMAQLAPAVSLLAQVFVWAKSAEFTPPRYRLEMLSKALPLLVSVTLWAALVEFRANWPNERLVVERLAMGAGAGPPPPPPPPPPQAAQIPTTSNRVANIQPAVRRRALAKLASVARASNPAHSQGPPAGRRKLGGILNCGVGGVALLPAEGVMVNMAVTAAEPVKLSDGGETVQDPPGIAVTPQDRFMAPVNPPRGVMVIVEVPDSPGAEMLMVVGLAEILKSATVTVTAGEVEPA
jgi:hypothetical protein